MFQFAFATRPICAGMRFGGCLEFHNDRREQETLAPRGIEYRLVVTETSTESLLSEMRVCRPKSMHIESRSSNLLLKTSPSDLEAPSNDKLE